MTVFKLALSLDTKNSLHMIICVPTMSITQLTTTLLLNNSQNYIM